LSSYEAFDTLPRFLNVRTTLFVARESFAEEYEMPVVAFVPVPVFRTRGLAANAWRGEKNEKMIERKMIGMSLRIRAIIPITEGLGYNIGSV